LLFTYAKRSQACVPCCCSGMMLSAWTMRPKPGSYPLHCVAGTLRSHLAW
jgi:hypothetical protein